MLPSQKLVGCNQLKMVAEIWITRQLHALGPRAQGVGEGTVGSGLQESNARGPMYRFVLSRLSGAPSRLLSSSFHKNSDSQHFGIHTKLNQCRRFKLKPGRGEDLMRQLQRTSKRRSSTSGPEAGSGAGSGPAWPSHVVMNRASSRHACRAGDADLAHVPMTIRLHRVRITLHRMAILLHRMTIILHRMIILLHGSAIILPRMAIT